MHYSTILGIESSCDDTAAAVWHKGKILANVIATQKIHQDYGGVVPELASRAHQSNLVPVISEALKKSQLTISEINAVAVTQGPGLLGSLHVGWNFAKGLAMSAQIPMIGVNHLQAHLASVFIQHPQPQFPMLCLLVSGGHTQILLAKNTLQYEILGQTIDDAAGEAFDKAAKMLGFPYPGGPFIDQWAAKGNAQAYQFPFPKTDALNFSFSGLKTSLLYFLRDMQKDDPYFTERNKADICASYQSHIVHYLLRKFSLAIEQIKPKSMALAGGVSANSLLRSAFINLGEQKNLNILIPDFEYCTDNAAMIAVAGHYLLESGLKTEWNAQPFAR